MLTVNFYDHSSREVEKQLQPDQSELRRITCNGNCTTISSVYSRCFKGGRRTLQGQSWNVPGEEWCQT